MTATPPKLLTVKEGAVELGKGYSTVYRWIRDGLVPFRTLPNGRLRFTEDDLGKIRELMATAAFHPRQPRG